MPPSSSGLPPVAVVTRGGETNWVERSNTLMAWAVRAIDRRATHVSMLARSETGLACSCVCPACGGTLQAVNAGKSAEEYLRPGSMRPFFRHHTGQQRDECLRRVAQIAALELLAQKQEIDLPAPVARYQVVGASGDIYTGVASGRTLRARIVERSWIDEQTATLTLEGGRTIRVCLAGSQYVSDDSGVDAVITIRIDDPLVSTWSPAEILSKVQLAGHWLCWMKHWEDAALSAEAKAKAEERAREAIDLIPDDLDLPEGLTQLQRTETVLHAVLKNMLAEAGSIRVPGLRAEFARKMPDGEIRTKVAEIVGPIELYLAEVRLERHIGALVPDIVCTASAPGRDLPPADLLIEVAVTHRVDGEKARRIRELGLACVELDVALLGRSGRVKLPQLRQAVRNDASNKRWITHPHFEILREQAKAELEQELRLHADLARRADLLRTWFSTGSASEVIQAFLGLAWAERAGRPVRTTDGVSWKAAEVADLLGARGLTGLRNVAFLTALWRLSVIRDVAGGKAGSVREVLRQAQEERFEGRRWLTLLLAGVAVYRPRLHAADQQWIAHLEHEAYEDLAGGSFAFARPQAFDATIAAAFPEMEQFLADERGTEAQAEFVRAQQRERRNAERLEKEEEALRLLEEERRQRQTQEEERLAGERREAEIRAQQIAQRAEEELEARRRRNSAWAWQPPGIGSKEPTQALRLVRSKLRVLPANVRRIEGLLQDACHARAVGQSFPAFVLQVEKDGQYTAEGVVNVLKAAALIAPVRVPDTPEKSLD